MKVKFAEDTTLQAVGARGTSAFNIATTAHMFHILSSGLYSDKVGAVLRELGCNAMDAHIMSGQPQRPFEVKLPTPLDPTFHIKDWGPGLDHLEVTELYTTYGMSTKQHSNDATGAFGLGSKSPFAYADMFTIVAVKDGVQRIYTAHKDHDAPVISLQSEAPAQPDWPHGVMVMLPVAPADAPEFRRKALSVFRWFSVLPDVLGLGPDELREAVVEFRFRGPGYAIGADAEHRNAQVVMGNVAYPVDAARLAPLTNIQRDLLGSGVHLWLPVGTVMPTPSRESLQYDKEGQVALRAALDAAALDIAHGMVSRIRELKDCTWEWARRIQLYLKELPISIRSSIMEFVKLVVQDAAELAHIERMAKSTHLALPAWAGPWRTAGAQGTSPAAASVASPTGQALWWLHAQTEGGKARVSRKAVWGGAVTERGERATVTLGYSDPLGVFHVNGSYGMERVRAWVAEQGRTSVSGRANALVVAVRDRADYDEAQRYAERLAGPEGCDLPEGPRGTASLPFDEVGARRRRKTQTVDPRVHHRAEQVDYVNLRIQAGTPRRTRIAMADVPAEDYAYMVNDSRSTRSWRQAFSTTTATDGRVKFNEQEALGRLLALAQLAQVLGDQWTGPRGVLIVRPGQLKTMELARAGFQPLGKALHAALVQPDALARLAANIERYPTPTALSGWGCDQFGLAGFIARVVHAKTALGEAIRTQFDGNPVVEDGLNLARCFEVSHRKGPKPPDVRALVARVEGFVPELAKALNARVTMLDSSDIRARGKALFPLSAYLDLDALPVADEKMAETLKVLEFVFSHPAKASLSAHPSGEQLMLA